MGRHAEGWKLEWRRGIGYVRFTHAKRQHLISTGKRDPREAREEAARLYARVVGGGVARPASTRALRCAPLKILLAEWLASLDGTLDEETIKTYETTYAGKHWLAHFDSIEDMCSETARERYRSARLKAAVASTVKKECWAQDKFLRWCKRSKIIVDVPPRLEWDKRTLGTRTGKQRAKAQELTIEQVRDFLLAIPEWFEVGKRALEKRPFPIRDRFVFAYETSLRPATISDLRWDDWKGPSLTIRDEADKVRYGRDVPLSEGAIAALERVQEGAARRGVNVEPQARIFGKHIYRKTIAKAARAAGLRTVAPYDLRHARATHMADRGSSLTGIGYIMGHKQATTTSRYLHGSSRAAQDALAAAPTFRVPEETDLEPDSGSGVTDGVRTRDTWSHKAPADQRSCDLSADAVAAASRRKPHDSAPNRVQHPESERAVPGELPPGYEGTRVDVDGEEATVLVEPGDGPEDVNRRVSKAVGHLRREAAGGER